LYAAIVAGAQEFSGGIENCGADGNAAFGEAFAGFGDRDLEHGRVTWSGHHTEVYGEVGGNGYQVQLVANEAMSFSMRIGRADS
jgi:hypothetical protein